MNSKVKADSMNNSHISKSLVWFILLCPCWAFAAEYDPNEVLAYQGDTVITQQEIDAAFNKVPEENRLEFIRDGEKVNFLLGTLLLNKKLALEGRKAGLDEDPLVSLRQQQAADQELGLAWKEYMLNDAPEADYESLAYEDYLSNLDKYKTAEQRDISHILIRSSERGEDQALALANQIYSQLQENPEQFEALVAQYSEDDGSVDNKGRFPSVRRGDMVPQFERVAFRLKSDGDISKPVQTRYGYHIIRLNSRLAPKQLPFEDVRDQLAGKAKRDHQIRYRDQYISNLVKDPIESPEGALEIMVKRHFGENLERARDYRNDGELEEGG
jgi:parvulin-like peptidyl-prolyl isomerase